MQVPSRSRACCSTTQSIFRRTFAPQGLRVDILHASSTHDLGPPSAGNPAANVPQTRQTGSIDHRPKVGAAQAPSKLITVPKPDTPDNRPGRQSFWQSRCHHVGNTRVRHSACSAGAWGATPARSGPGRRSGPAPPAACRVCTGVGARAATRHLPPAKPRKPRESTVSEVRSHHEDTADQTSPRWRLLRPAKAPVREPRTMVPARRT